MQKPIDFILQVRDYDCEQLLLHGSVNEKQKAVTSCRKNNTWTNLALQSACVAVQDICLLPTDQITPLAVEAAVMRRFTNRHYQFHSNEHFVQVRAQVSKHMQSFLAHRKHEGELLASFEAFTVSIHELDIELIQYFHMLYYEASSNTYTVQRLMSEPNDLLLQLYYHMTTLFVSHAFVGANIKIEALFPLTGKIISWQPDLENLQQSLDYMELLRTLLLNDEASTTLHS